MVERYRNNPIDNVFMHNRRHDETFVTVLACTGSWKVFRSSLMLTFMTLTCYDVVFIYSMHKPSYELNSNTFNVQ